MLADAFFEKVAEGAKSPISSWSSVGSVGTSLIVSGVSWVRGVSIPFAYKWLKSSLEKLFGNSGEDPDKSSASRQEGVKGAIYLDLPHQGLTIQAPQPIFQTVSLGISVNRGNKEGPEPT